MADQAGSDIDLDTSEIRNWRSIVTLIVFVFTNIVVLFPFHVPIYVPRPLWNALRQSLTGLRIIPARQDATTQDNESDDKSARLSSPNTRFRIFQFPLNFVTAPLIADLFLLAILAIGRKEVHDGTIGDENIFPIDIMAFFITLAYIAISIDASGLIRYLAFRILQRGGNYGHRLFFYLYAFFFGLSSAVGNDPVILSGTAFLAYMTRISENIKHPRAWIHMQFAVANIGSTILVSSNPTNLVLAGAFSIKFIVYAGNVVVPVVATGIILFPFLLYVIFPYESLIPSKIELHELPEDRKEKTPVNPNIPNVEAADDEDEDDEQVKLARLEEIMNPFLDKGGAAFGALIMTATLVTILVVNAVSQRGSEIPVYWVTSPAAFVMLCWDMAYGWRLRKKTREIARTRREDRLRSRAERQIKDEDFQHFLLKTTEIQAAEKAGKDGLWNEKDDPDGRPRIHPAYELADPVRASIDPTQPEIPPTPTSEEIREREKRILQRMEQLRPQPGPTTLQSLVADSYQWCQETFPTVTVVATHLPWKLVPFAFCMFVLVQALVTKGWVPVFAYGWDHWVAKTGVVGAIGGMAFLGVVLCNFAGTNIGTTILLCRVVQAWQSIHRNNGIPISDREFWATIYSMAIAVNYGAFSMAFSAALAGLLWRDILQRKHIQVRELDFARINLPIIAVSMVVGCTVLVGEVYIVRSGDKPYSGG